MCCENDMKLEILSGIVRIEDMELTCLSKLIKVDIYIDSSVYILNWLLFCYFSICYIRFIVTY